MSISAKTIQELNALRGFSSILGASSFDANYSRLAPRCVVWSAIAFLAVHSAVVYFFWSMGATSSYANFSVTVVNVYFLEISVLSWTALFAPFVSLGEWRRLNDALIRAEELTERCTGKIKLNETSRQLYKNAAFRFLALLGLLLNFTVLQKFDLAQMLERSFGLFLPCWQGQCLDSQFLFIVTFVTRYVVNATRALKRIETTEEVLSLFRSLTDVVAIARSLFAPQIFITICIHTLIGTEGIYITMGLIYNTKKIASPHYAASCFANVVISFYSLWLLSVTSSRLSEAVLRHLAESQLSIVFFLLFLTFNSAQGDDFNRTLFRLALTDRSGKLARNEYVVMHLSVRPKLTLDGFKFFSLDEIFLGKIVVGATSLLMIIIQVGQQQESR